MTDTELEEGIMRRLGFSFALPSSCPSNSPDSWRVWLDRTGDVVGRETPGDVLFSRHVRLLAGDCCETDRRPRFATSHRAAFSLLSVMKARGWSYWLSDEGQPRCELHWRCGAAFVACRAASIPRAIAETAYEALRLERGA
jgi:hypothetical protein